MRRYCNHCGMEVEFIEYRENSHAELWENSHAELRENSHAVLWGNSHAVLWGNSHAVLWGNSHAELRENSHAELRGNSHAVLWENSHAVLWGNSHAELRGNSHAVLWENSHAELRENSHAELRENSHAQCNSPYACSILKEVTASCIGRHIGNKPLSPKEYLTYCGVPIKNQFVTLYKSVNKNFTSKHSSHVIYTIGKEVIAPDWSDTFKDECGCGLHLSPTIKQAVSFHDDKTYLACRVNIKNIASLPAFAQYPDKIRVRACTPLYQVDIDGNKIT